MKHLFSPWRMKYVTNEIKQEGCVFCHVLDMEDNAENLIIYRGEKAYVIINRYPYTSGHIMIVPYAHQARLEALDAETRAEMMELTARGNSVLENLYHPQGFNIGLNLGAAGGAGIEEHIHIHIVPRWFGDTNFMTAVGETRVVPEAIEETWRRIRAAWKETKNL